ncbi:hypothetical protein CcaverHIS002_0505920 [Cutaneotrichosporon cavernicola]|uniref:N-acetylglucosamine-6-phosphate deacetylase n=1 Tax=Cutaneotrichosporon cavernicola TaxID=279322 RepID=A0AA48QX85_9TREE|nr:uncharacterized protein CcaverHIS019_0506450 [Cutaneotrichosporon cavernicola]BEI85191.1 hypothetical protein CcaverHIS002_0505920 [Cutaneotrichosporon cavernicola]BEI93017.1 hypothetical protein CcaverHIS019_0506450 [Cutaneotrichosporon cavernicola]BEJ00793.1 hypothetical protein CcaverHIS631_0506500 [Cutaneotrichosporon cavernicola]BEJ08559.1 hypothetical protein CcaverHIS641_0506530 [Cutaneotrichosporon cavernicola]
MTDIVRFTNGFIAMPDGTALKGDLYVDTTTGLIIAGQENFFTTCQRPSRVVDLDGGILSPGLIDVQINGAYGVDFSDVELGPGGNDKYLAGLDHVAERIVETGTTSLVPTIITQKEELYAKLLRLLAPRSSKNSAHILGYHAEGPFLHPDRKGMHTTELLLTANTTPPIDAFDAVYGKDGLDQEGVKMITAAPDVEGVMDCIEPLTKRGVIFSIGHSDANLKQGQQAVARGANMITHLFNAMPPIHHRDPGLVGLLGETDARPYYGIIADGLHLHPNTVRIAYGAAPDRCILVTDAQWILDPTLPDGLHHWRGGFSFHKEGLRVVLEGTDTLAGSAIPFYQCIGNLSQWAGITIPQALVCATYHPAQMLGGRVAQTKGQLNVGFDADLVVFGWDGSLRSTWVMGKEVYRNPEIASGNVLRPRTEVNGKAH